MGGGKLHGRVALVTGASRGIGRAVALRLARLGATVHLLGRNQDALGDVADEVKVHDGQAVMHTGDLRDAAHLDELRDGLQTSGGLDVLVNNAGVGQFTRIEDTSDEDWDRLFETNVTAVFRLCRRLLPLMKGRADATIFQVSSLAGSNPFAGGAAYCASKAALDAFTTALMLEARDDGVRVVSLAPGSVATHFSGRTETGADWKLAPEDVADAVEYVLGAGANALPSRIELRPRRPGS